MGFVKNGDASQGISIKLKMKSGERDQMIVDSNSIPYSRVFA